MLDHDEAHIHPHVKKKLRCYFAAHFYFAASSPLLHRAASAPLSSPLARCYFAAHSPLFHFTSPLHRGSPLFFTWAMSLRKTNSFSIANALQILQLCSKPSIVWSGLINLSKTVKPMKLNCLYWQWPCRDNHIILADDRSNIVDKGHFLRIYPCKVKHKIVQKKIPPLL